MNYAAVVRNNMKKTERHKETLLMHLQKYKKMTIRDIAEKLSVSEPTARRIASALAEEQKVLRIHGGIHYIPESEYDYSFDMFEKEYIEEKAAIGKYASTMIKDNDIIFLEAGTTIRHLALAIAQRFRDNELKNPYIFTNSLDNLTILSPYCNVTLIGGEYRPKRKDFVGYISEKIIKSLSFHLCFLGSDGIGLNEGIMATDINTVRFDELLIKRSKQSIVLSDSSKFEKISYVSFASLDEISMIITDDKLPLEKQIEYRNLGVNLVCVAKGQID
jgi:DeoR family fructose operon transcriptional repressor